MIEDRNSDPRKIEESGPELMMILPTSFGHASQLQFLIRSKLFNVGVTGFRAEKRQHLFKRTGMLKCESCIVLGCSDGLLMSATTAGTLRFFVLILRTAELTRDCRLILPV